MDERDSPLLRWGEKVASGSVMPPVGRMLHAVLLGQT